MHLVQLFLPLYDNDARPFPVDFYADLRRALTERCGGVTFYVRAPAEGTWKSDDGDARHDAIVVMEVMTESLDRPWWRRLRTDLCRQFRQESLLVRAWPIETL